MESIGTFILDQVLKMQWLSGLVAALLGALGIDAAGQWGGTLHFFIYDTVKIVILLCVLIFAISYIQSHFPPARGYAALVVVSRWSLASHAHRLSLGSAYAPCLGKRKPRRSGVGTSQSVIHHWTTRERNLSLSSSLISSSVFPLLTPMISNFSSGVAILILIPLTRI